MSIYMYTAHLCVFFFIYLAGTDAYGQQAHSYYAQHGSQTPGLLVFRASLILLQV